MLLRKCVCPPIKFKQHSIAGAQSQYFLKSKKCKPNDFFFEFSSLLNPRSNEVGVLTYCQYLDYFVEKMQKFSLHPALRPDPLKLFEVFSRGRRPREKTQFSDNWNQKIFIFDSIWQKNYRLLFSFAAHFCKLTLVCAFTFLKTILAYFSQMKRTARERVFI